jgi:hypothetical protein
MLTVRTPASVFGGPTCAPNLVQVTPRRTEMSSAVMSLRRSSRTSPLRSWHHAPICTAAASGAGIAAASSFTCAGPATTVWVAGLAFDAPRTRQGFTAMSSSSIAVVRTPRSSA